MQSLSRVTEGALAALREELSKQISPRRFAHILGVEEEAEKIAKWYLPQNIIEIKAASLLHDLTKERSTEEQISLCKRYGLPVTQAELASPKIFHAKTAAAVIADHYPLFATEEILDAVAKHTTGAAEMSLFAKILYLADYTEKTRTFDDCVRLREYFWSVDFSKMTEEERIIHLDKALLMSFEMTLSDLAENNLPAAPDTRAAYDALLQQLNSKN
jgi:nicotinate-nucleotide adenylyltransferase